MIVSITRNLKLFLYYFYRILSTYLFYIMLFDVRWSLSLLIVTRITFGEIHIHLQQREVWTSCFWTVCATSLCLYYMMSLMWIVLYNVSDVNRFLNVLLFDIIILLLFYLSITMSSTRILLLLLSYLDYFSIVDNCTIDFAYIQFCVGNISDVSRFILIFW